MSIKRMSKIVIALVIIATILSAVSMVFATGNNPGGAVAMPTGDGSAVAAIKNPVNRIVGVVQFICYAAAIILIVILGVKFMTASPDGKAEIKKSAVIYVVGAVLVFAAGTVVQLIGNLGNNVVS